MQKLKLFIKPYMMITFGASMLLFYLDWLGGTTEQLILGILALVIAAYFIVSGLLRFFNKENSLAKLFDFLNAFLFPFFLFVYALIAIIASARFLGPAGWVILILLLLATLGVSVMLILNQINKEGKFKKLLGAFSLCYYMMLVVIILFGIDGTPLTLGRINIPEVMMYAISAYLLFMFLNKKKHKEELEDKSDR